MLLNSQKVFQFLRGAKKDAIQQVSVDLHVKSIKAVWGGYIFTDKKGIAPYTEVDLEEFLGTRSLWKLHSGTYSITFEEDCEIPEDKTGMILHKSTLVRMGGSLDCGIYDPGYKSVGGMGAVLTVGNNCRIEIEKGSKVATFYMFENLPVEKDLLYNGSYQGNKDVK